MSASLHQRLGGQAQIEAIVDDAIDRHAANPRLAERLRGWDLPYLKALGVSFLSTCAGGPSRAEGGAGLTTASANGRYAGMTFDEDEWAAVMDDLVAALAEHGVAENEIREIAGLLRSAMAEAGHR